jgi:large subunit ribosomal protein L1
MPFDREAVVESIRRSLGLGKPRRFKQSVDLVIVLSGLDLKSQEARLREVVILPKVLGRSRRVCFVAEGDMLLEARKLGVEVYSRDEVQAFSKKDARRVAERCDWVLVRADLMGIAGRVLGPALGPRGKAPIPVPPNANVRELLDRYSRAVWVRVRNQPQIACSIGAEDMSVEDLAENALTVLDLVESKLGPGRIGAIYVKKTMSPPVELRPL